MSFEDLDDTNDAHERRIVRCRSCNARIIFLETAQAKKIPVDADTVESDDTEFDADRHVTHFRTCTDPQRFRRPK